MPPLLCLPTSSFLLSLLFLPPHLSCSASFHSHERMLGLLPVQSIDTIRMHIPLLLSSIASAYFCHSRLFLPCFYHAIYFMRARTNHTVLPKQASKEPQALGIWNSFILLCGICSDRAPGWRLGKWAEEFYHVQQGYTSFVKQAVFNYASDTILTINTSFNKKPICTPAGYLTSTVGMVILFLLCKIHLYKNALYLCCLVYAPICCNS